MGVLRSPDEARGVAHCQGRSEELVVRQQGDDFAARLGLDADLHDGTEIFDLADRTGQTFIGRKRCDVATIGTDSDGAAVLIDHIVAAYEAR
jgi:hypothetical protein